MLLLLLAKSVLAGVTVTVPSEGWVRGTEIELGELCTVEGTDPDLVARARALSLGYAPAPGFARVLTLSRIQEELARALSGCAVRVTGERLCQVRPQVEELSPARLEAAARLELEHEFQGVPASFTLSRALDPIRIPLGHGPSVIHARASVARRASGTYGVALEILVDGQPYRTTWTSWRVDVWETRSVLGSVDARSTILGGPCSPLDAASDPRLHAGLR